MAARGEAPIAPSEPGSGPSAPPRSTGSARSRSSQRGGRLEPLDPWRRTTQAKAEAQMDMETEYMESQTRAFPPPSGITRELQRIDVEPLEADPLAPAAPGSEATGDADATLSPYGEDDGEGEGGRVALGGEAAGAPSLRHPTATPVLYYLVLFLALLAISCAGTLLRQLADTPPLLKAFWRLFFVSWYLAAGFSWQWFHASAVLKARFWSWRTQSLLLLTGAITAAHFGCWIYSLQHTSLSHSLFFVCSHPLLVVAVMRIQGKAVSGAEAAGVAVGLLGSALMLLDGIVASNAGGGGGDGDGADSNGAAAGSSDNNGAIPVTLFGDFMAFLGAAAMVGYLMAGKHCRSFLPLFLYAFPVTLSASICMLLSSAALEDVTLAGLTTRSVFGFLSARSLPVMLLIVLGPGITGHLGIQLVLSHIPPLAVSVVITVEPILGALVGVAAGVEEWPHVFTILGGPLSLAGCLLAVYGSWKRERSEEEQHRSLSSSSPPAAAVNDAEQAGPISARANDALGRHQLLPPMATDDTTAHESGVELQRVDWSSDEQMGTHNAGARAEGAHPTRAFPSSPSSSATTQIDPSSPDGMRSMHVASSKGITLSHGHGHGHGGTRPPRSARYAILDEGDSDAEEDVFAASEEEEEEDPREL